MSNKLERFSVLFTKRNAIKRGPTSSEAHNDTIEELSHDLTEINSQWNNRLVPLLSLLPNGSEGNSLNAIDAWTDGLDGSTLFVDAAATSTSNSSYFNSIADRPNTLLEQLEAVYSQLSQLQSDLSTQIAQQTPLAEQISITDTGAIYLATNVETALQEVMNKADLALTAGSDLTAIETDVKPNVDNTRDIGSASFRWRDLYLGPGSLNIHSLVTDVGYIAKDWHLGIKSGSFGELQIKDGTTSVLELSEASGLVSPTFGQYATQPYVTSGLSTLETSLQSYVTSGLAVVTSVIGTLDWQESVLSKTETDPDLLTPTTGDRYLIPDEGTFNAWIGHEQQIAEWNSTDWDYTTLTEGAIVYVEQDGKTYAYVGGSWVVYANTLSHIDLADNSFDSHPQYVMSAGRAGSQQVLGGVDAGGSLTLGSTYNATKGNIYVGSYFGGKGFVLDETTGHITQSVTANLPYGLLTSNLSTGNLAQARNQVSCGNASLWYAALSDANIANPLGAPGGAAALGTNSVTSGLWIGNGGATPIVFATNSSEIARFSSAGRLSIGVSSTSSKLHVQAPSTDLAALALTHYNSGGTQAGAFNWHADPALSSGFSLNSLINDTGAFIYVNTTQDRGIGLANGSVTFPALPTTRLWISDPTSGGKVGIGNGTTDSANQLSVVGALGVGSATYYTTAAPANGAIIEGSVGIGTSAPTSSAKLDVTISSATSGLAVIEYANDTGASYTYERFARGTSAAWAVGMDSVNSDRFKWAYTTNAGSGLGTGTMMTLTTGGLLAVGGTATPTYNVDAITNQNALTAVRALNQNTGTAALAASLVQANTAGLQMFALGSNYNSTQLGSNFASPRAVISTDSSTSSGLWIGTEHASAPLVLVTGGAEKMRIHPGGKVSIGTINLLEQFSILNNQNAGTYSSITNTNAGTAAAAGNFLVTDGNKQFTFILYSNAYNSTQLGSALPGRALISANANVTAGLWLGTEAGAPVVFVASGVERMRIDKGPTTLVTVSGQLSVRPAGASTGAEQFGASAQAGTGSTSLGFNANGSGATSVAVGRNTQATATNTTAVGENALATGAGATALGQFAAAQASGTALGNAANAGTSSNLAVGAGAQSLGTNGSYSFGYNSQNQSTGSSLAIAYNITLSNMANSIYLGQRGAYGGSANRSGFPNSVAIGWGLEVSGTSQVAVGYNTFTDGLQNVNIGVNAVASGINSTTLGANAKTNTFSNAIALGAGATVSGNNIGQISYPGAPVDFTNYGGWTSSYFTVAGNTTAPTVEGTIRWTGSDLEGRKGGSWVSLTAGAGSAPGANSQIIFNDNGASGADADLTFDKTNNYLLLTSGVNDGSVFIGSTSFGLDLLSSSDVRLVTDTSDYLQYDRATNRYNFNIASTLVSWVTSGLTPLNAEGALGLKESAAPSATASYGKIFAQSTDKELHFFDSAGRDTQITISGVVAVKVGGTSTPTGTTQTIDWRNGLVQTLDLESATGNVTLTLSNPYIGQTHVLKIIQDSTTPRDIVWPATVKWQQGATPTISTGGDAVDVVTLLFDGSVFYANIGQNYS